MTPGLAISEKTQRLLKPINPCSKCLGMAWGCDGYVPASGTGKNGVLIIAEAAGKEEAESGTPLVGSAGQYLWSQLKRVGIYRDDFLVHNVLSCKPPDNKLKDMPYEAQVIEACAPLLDATIAGHVAFCKTIGREPVIVTLGKIAFKRIMGLQDWSPMMREDYIGYVHWHSQYRCWVIAADHPSYLMRGYHHLTPILQFVFRRALEVAAGGLRRPDESGYMLDVNSAIFRGWVADYLRAYKLDPSLILSYDIETPHKQGEDEEEVAKEMDDDYTILRYGFAYRGGHPVSIPNDPTYSGTIKALMASPGQKLGWNNCPTPDQKILTANLHWVRADSLVKGDIIVGLDEEVQPGNKLRRFKKAKVTHAQLGNAPVYKIGFSDGSFVKVSDEHRWLLPQRNHKKRRPGSQWIKTTELRIGDFIQRKFPVWEEDVSKDAGYLAGFFDGEGHLTSVTDKGVMNIGASQNNGPTLEYVLSLMEQKGFISRRKPHTREKDRNHTDFVVTGGMGNVAKFLGSIRPYRLLTKFKPELLGSVRGIGAGELRVTSIEYLGRQDIVELSTDVHTYVMEGFIAHNCNYDDPRILRKMPINGDRLDGMLAWHVLNSAMPKGLGFVTPFYWQDVEMWKHLSKDRPAFYNAKDAEAALRCWEGIKTGLVAEGLWEVYNRHVIQINKVFGYMSTQGVQRDDALRLEAETKLTGLLGEVNQKLQDAVPIAARRLKIYKKTPKGIKCKRCDLFYKDLEQENCICFDSYGHSWMSDEGLIEVPGKVKVKVCPSCGYFPVKQAHFKSIGKKRLKAGDTEQPCFGQTAVIEEKDTLCWALPLPWKVSIQGLKAYQAAKKHKPIWNRKENRVTFDEPAIYKLSKHYPKDPLYPLVLENREYTKLRSTYVGITTPEGIVGGLPVGDDGLIHTIFTHNPSTLRSASQNPNLQNLPRVDKKNPDALGNIIRNLILARPGSTFIARDYSGIEAVLVGYEAQDPGYIRLAKQDVHSFYTVYALYELGDQRVKSTDLPDLSWPDDKLFPHLADLKSRFGSERNALYKHLVHGANFMQGAMGARDKIFAETRKEFEVSLVQRVMDIYFSLFPKIKVWHHDLLLQAERDGYLRNAFGYVHRFSRVFEYENIEGSWIKNPGPESNKVIAFKPQSTAAAIIKEAMLRLYQDRFEEAGQYLRLLVHDELLFEVPEAIASQVDEIVREEMEKPIPQLPLDSAWNLGDYLIVNTEAKKPNVRWGSM